MEYSKIPASLRIAMKAFDAAYQEVQRQFQLLDQDTVPTTLNANSVIAHEAPKPESIPALEGQGIEEHGVCLVAADYLVYDFDAGGTPTRPNRLIVIAPYIDGESDPEFHKRLERISADEDFVGLVNDSVVPGGKRPSSWTSKPEFTTFEVLSPTKGRKQWMIDSGLLTQAEVDAMDEETFTKTYNAAREFVGLEQTARGVDPAIVDAVFKPNDVMGANSSGIFGGPQTITASVFVITEGEHIVLAIPSELPLDLENKEEILNDWPAFYNETFSLSSEATVELVHFTLDVNSGDESIIGDYRIDFHTMRDVELGGIKTRLFDAVKLEKK